MAKLFVIFNLASGTASILGLVYILLDYESHDFMGLVAVLYALVAIGSLYVLFVPSNWLERNAAQKMQYYKCSIENGSSGKILIQRGQFSFDGYSTAIEFYRPYSSVPEVEVINIKGHRYKYVPKIEMVTPHQVSFFRDSEYGGAYKFIWIARGEPLQQANEE